MAAPTNGQGQAATVQALTQRLRVMEDRFHALAAASASINWLTTGDGLIEDAPHWRLFTGQTVEQARGWGWLDAIQLEDYPRAVAAWREALGQRLPYTDEYRLRRADGVYRDLLTQAAPIYEDDGSVREWVGVRIFTRATSLGGVESLIEHRASIEGPESRTPQNLLRVSVGLEHPDDLIEDLDQALSQVRRS